MPNLLCSSVLHSAARHTLEATAGRRPPQSKTYWRRTPMMGTVVKVLVAELPRMAMGKAVLVPDLQRHYTTNWGRIVMVAVVVVLLRAQHMPMLPTAARSRSTCHKGCSGATAGHPPRQTVRLRKSTASDRDLDADAHVALVVGTTCLLLRQQAACPSTGSRQSSLPSMSRQEFAFTAHCSDVFFNIETEQLLFLPATWYSIGHTFV